VGRLLKQNQVPYGFTFRVTFLCWGEIQYLIHTKRFHTRQTKMYLDNKLRTIIITNCITKYRWFAPIKTNFWILSLTSQNQHIINLLPEHFIYSSISLIWFKSLTSCYIIAVTKTFEKHPKTSTLIDNHKHRLKGMKNMCIH